MAKVPKIKTRLVFICLRNAYENNTPVTYEQLEAIVPEITSNYKYLLDRIFKNLQKEHQYFFDFEYSKNGKRYIPSLRDSYHFNYIKCIEKPFSLVDNLVLLFKEAYEQNKFVTDRKIKAILFNKARNNRNKSRCSSLIEKALEILKQEYNYEFDVLTNTGYYPVRKDIIFPTKTIELIVILKKKYESKEFISYADLNCIIPNDITKYKHCLRKALSNLKRNYNYRFERDLRGYFPLLENENETKL
jgi:hypothetical protein